MSKTVLQVLLGLALCAMLAAAWLYLGPFWEALSPDGNSYAITWRSGMAFLLLLVVTQWGSLMAFRRHVALQVFVGLALCAVFASVLLHSAFCFSWERHLPDGTFIVGWKSDVLFLLLAAITQGVSFLAFRLIRRDPPKPPTGTVASQVRS
jgi:hypothetical protein